MAIERLAKKFSPAGEGKSAEANKKFPEERRASTAQKEEKDAEIKGGTKELTLEEARKKSASLESESEAGKKDFSAHLPFDDKEGLGEGDGKNLGAAPPERS